MTAAKVSGRERISRRQVDKFGERRAQLAESVIATLAELGLAKTSLREIAQKSEFSHGVLHYYFADKTELLTYSVRRYEEACITRYDDLVASADTAEQLKAGFGAAMATTLRAEAPMHRLWYDMRNQSLFEQAYRADVLDIDQQRQQMVWRVVARYADLTGITPKVSEQVAYSTFDGLFQSALVQFLAGDEDAPERLAESVPTLLGLLVPPA